MLFKGIEQKAFYQTFTDDETCMAYLAELKWASGYCCRQCNATQYMPGKRPYSRRCRVCKYDESATSHTLFHKVKFSLLVAFELVFRLSTIKKGLSALALSQELGIHYETCLNFRKKIQTAMESSEQHPLEGHIEVDEFMVGGYDPDAPGRSKGDKKLVAVALEVLPNKKKGAQKAFGRAYAIQIEDFSNQELKKLFDKHISKQARVKTDKWRGYLPIQKVYPLLKQELSNAGKNFQELHLHIMNIKNWVRGIHHHVSDNYLQKYLDEYHFRFNRKSFRESIFHKLIERMVAHPPVFYKNLLVQT